jgi:hypothetical protein
MIIFMIKMFDKTFIPDKSCRKKRKFSKFDKGHI